MVMARKLRAVEADETPAPVLTLAQAIETNDHLTILIAQRRDIVASLPEEKGPAKAALHRQLSLISKEIEVLMLRDAEDGPDAEPTADEAWDQSAI